MKKNLILLIFLIVFISFIGCSINNQESEQNMLMRKVKNFEINKAKLDNLEITYGEFKKNVQGTFTIGFEKQYLKKLNTTQILNIDGDEILLKDLDDISEEKFQEYKEKMEQTKEEYGVKKLERKIELSNGNYEGTLEDTKRVYSKTLEIFYQINKEPSNILIFKVYDFKKENNKWKITMIKESSIQIDNLNEIELKEELSKMAFNPETNQEIKYIESINITLE